MTDKSFDHRMQRFFTWMFGAAFAIATVMTHYAFSQRDEALRFRAQYGDVSLSCRVLDGGAEAALKSTETRADQGAEGGAK